ncbi:MAG: hypothetical protein GXP46_06895 [Deferribacteres bacterium]|nr:hypothetical protein [Deferribacteres bacterium]
MTLPEVSEREKKFLAVGGIIVFLIIIFQVFSWYDDFRREVRELSDARRFKLERQLIRLSQKERIEKRFEEVKQMLARQERALLRGNKPPVAAAELQKFLKETASSLDIEVKLERTLSPVETEFYLGIPVEIGFTASTGKLEGLLFRLRKSPFLLMVSEMKVRVTNIRNPVDIYTTLIVTGFIKKPEIKNKKGTET